MSRVVSSVVPAPDGTLIAYRSNNTETRPRVVMVHATGFCKELWSPVVAEVAEARCSFSSTLIDLRAHGGSGRPERPFDWWDLAGDVLAVLGGARSNLGVGHSAGATALVMAELEAPGTFDELLLIEPIIFPGPYRRVEQPLAVGARRRQRTFATHAEALERFSSRALFARWLPEMLDLYVEHGLELEGDSLALRCDPEDEAEFYNSARQCNVWERLPELDLPVTVMVGDHSDSHSPEFVVEQAGRIAGSTVVFIPESSHLVPMERPGVVVDWLTNRLACGASQNEAD